jgi:hypothetical protein
MPLMFDNAFHIASESLEALHPRGAAYARLRGGQQTTTR